MLCNAGQPSNLNLGESFSGKLVHLVCILDVSYEAEHKALLVGHAVRSTLQLSKGNHAEAKSRFRKMQVRCQAHMSELHLEVKKSKEAHAVPLNFIELQSQL